MSVGLIGVVALMLVLFTNIISVIVLGNIAAPGRDVDRQHGGVDARPPRLPGGRLSDPGRPGAPGPGRPACVTQFFFYSLTDLAAAAAAMGLGLALYALRGHRRRLFPRGDRRDPRRDPRLSRRR